MNIKKIHIITVGKAKMPFYKEAIDFYSQRINYFCPLEENSVKDGDSSLSIEKRKEKEALLLQKVIKPQSCLICLDEHGKNLNSIEFSKLINSIALTHTPTFIIGGAYGFHSSFLQQGTHTLSFGKETLPHELAQTLLYEQVYRALTILKNIPYHHQ